MTRVADASPVVPAALARRKTGRLIGPNDACPFSLCDGKGLFFYDAATGDPIGYDQDGELDIGVDQREISMRCLCAGERTTLRTASRAAKTAPPELRGMSFERNPIPHLDPNTVKIAKRWVEVCDESNAQTKGLWFYGPPGTGKTSLAVAAMLTLSRRGYRCGYWRFSTLLKRIRATSFGEFADQTDDQWDAELTALDVLVLDDIGAEKSGQWGEQQLCDMLSDREEHGRPVIATTNLEEAVLQERFGPRIVSRLHGVCGPPIPLNGFDWRRHHPDQIHARTSELSPVDNDGGRS